jgi:hypothetical protein
MLQLAEPGLELALQGGIRTHGQAEPVPDGGIVVDIRAAYALYAAAEPGGDLAL